MNDIDYIVIYIFSISIYVFPNSFNSYRFRSFLRVGFIGIKCNLSTSLMQIFRTTLPVRIEFYEWKDKAGYSTLKNQFYYVHKTPWDLSSLTSSMEYRKGILANLQQKMLNMRNLNEFKIDIHMDPYWFLRRFYYIHCYYCPVNLNTEFQ